MSRLVRTVVAAAVGTLVMGLLSCQTMQAPIEPRRVGNLPPLKAPSEKIYCPVGGENGIGMPPRPWHEGQLTNAEVATFIEKRKKDVNECYEARVKRGYAIEGKVGMRFMVSPQGYVQQMCLVEDATGDADFLECLFGEIGTWQFPKKDAATEVRHRFTFKYSKT